MNATNLSGSCAITNSSFIGTPQKAYPGVYLDGQAGTSVFVGASTFTNYQAGLHLNANVDARVTCSEFSANEYGIAVMLNSTLDIGDEARNIFVNDLHDIHVVGDDEHNAIFLNEGHNDFAARNHNGGLYIYGFNTQEPSFLGGGTEIPANSNKMPTYSLGILHNVMPVDFTFSNNGSFGTTTVTLDIPNNLSSIPGNCDGDVLDYGHSGHYRMVHSIPFDGGRINSGSYPNVSLREATLDAIDNITIGEEERDDVMALARLIEILNSPVINTDIYTNTILSVAYQQMHQALSNAFQNGSLINVQDDALSVNDTVAAAVGIIDTLIADLDPSDTAQQHRYFKLHLDKVHAYRVSGNYNNAFNVLASSANWTFNFTQTQRIGFWNCVCEAEAAYFNEELAPEEFLHQVATCHQYFAGYNYKRSDFSSGQGYYVDLKSKLSMVLYPQPAESYVNLELSDIYEGPLSYEIMDVTGKQVQSAEVLMQGSMHQIDVSKLSQGVYMIHIELGSMHQQTLKFVKG